MSWTIMAQVGVAVLATYLEEENEDYAALAAGLGMAGANMLLCRYSREDERQADSLGLRYMAAAGFDPNGMSDLMQIFMNLHTEKPNIVDVLFATHPMSDERHRNAKNEIASTYSSGSWKQNRERYMDNTAALRKIGGALRLMQDGEEAIMKGEYAKAEDGLRKALKLAPRDYAGLLLLSKALYAAKNFREAEKYALEARAVYPEEPQALHVAGMVQIEMRKFDKAFALFNDYETKLPGNPNTVYFKGLCLDGQGRKADAADLYVQYLEQDPSGEYSQQVKDRLKLWGYVIPGEEAEGLN
jgi:predicted Zn-dependent protease